VPARAVCGRLAGRSLEAGERPCDPELVAGHGFSFGARRACHGRDVDLQPPAVAAK
jgi:hypothetical protein